MISNSQEKGRKAKYLNKIGQFWWTSHHFQKLMIEVWENVTSVAVSHKYTRDGLKIGQKVPALRNQVQLGKRGREESEMARYRKKQNKATERKRERVLDIKGKKVRQKRNEKEWKKQEETTEEKVLKENRFEKMREEM